MSDPNTPDAQEDGAGADDPVPVADGRLVLTPALRVTDGPGPKSADRSSPPDDAALRAIIREMLREELAGPLGERITRGVRKLVRTEVASLLAVRDPD